MHIDKVYTTHVYHPRLPPKKYKGFLNRKIIIPDIHPKLILSISVTDLRYVGFRASKKAVSLNPKEWLRLSESGSDGHLMTPILLHMIDEEGNSMMGITQDQLDKALDQASEVIPDTVARIYLYWQ